MGGARWIVVTVAMVLAGVAVYVLLGSEEHAAERTVREAMEPPMDDIDAESRAAMRELLRRADDAGEPGGE